MAHNPFGDDDDEDEDMGGGSANFNSTNVDSLGNGYGSAPPLPDSTNGNNGGGAESGGHFSTEREGEDSDDALQKLEQQRREAMSPTEAATSNAAAKRGWLVDTKTNTRWCCFLHPTCLDMFESVEAARDWTKPQRTIPLSVCSSVLLGGLLQNTLRINPDSETRILLLWSDYATSEEFRCADAQDCNMWYNAMMRVFDASRQTELSAMADIDDEDMLMRFRHARLWALDKVSAPDPLPRMQWVPGHVVTACSYCEEEFVNDFAKHHCRLCGDVYCSAHSKIAKDLELGAKPMRVCVWCYLIWRDYAQGVMDRDRAKLNWLGPIDDVDFDDELSALRNFRQDKAKERSEAAQVAEGAPAGGSRRMSITQTLSSLVTKFSGVFQKNNSMSPRRTASSQRGGNDDEPLNPFAGDDDIVDDDAADALLASGAASDSAADEDDHDNTSAQLAVLDNLLTVSTSNSQWMKKAEQSLNHEDVNYLDLTFEGWLMKRGKLGRDMKTMRPRYFVLRRGALKYYEHETDLSKEIGRVQLAYSTQVKVHPDYPRMMEICPGDNFVIAVEARTDAEAQEWKSKLREVIDAMRLVFITQTIHDEAYTNTLSRARASFESGQLHALYDKGSPELQPLKSGFACFKCARSFARVETSKVHCRSCGRLFCGLCASMQPIPPLCGGRGRPEGPVTFMAGTIKDKAQDLLETKYGFLFPPSDDAITKFKHELGGSKTKIHNRRLCWSCAFIFTSFPIVLFVEGNEKRAQQQREDELKQAAEAIEGQELLSKQIRELSQSIQDHEASVAVRNETQRKERATLVAHAQKLKAEVQKRGIQLNKLAVAYQELSNKQQELQNSKEEAAEESAELREQLRVFEKNLRHAHSQIQQLTKLNQHYSMELEKARTGILTMKQHMKLMKVNMGQLKQKMHQAAEETERQVRERQRLENEVNNQRQAVLLEGTEAIPVGEVSAMRSGSFGSDDNVLATSTRVDSMSVNDDEDWGEGMTVSDLTGTTKGMDLPSYADEAANQSARRGRRSSCAGTSPYAYQHDIPEILEFKKKVIRFLSEFAPQKLQENLYVERTLLKHRGHEKVLVDMLREQYERGNEGIRKYALDQDIPNGAPSDDDDAAVGPTQGVADAAKDGVNLSVNEEAMLLAQMQAIQAMQALTRWRVHDCSVYPINPKCDRIDAAPMRKLLSSWTQFREQREKLQQWAVGICTGAMFRDLDFIRRVDLQKVPCEYAEAILKLLVPVVQKSAPDDIKVHIRLTPGQENGNVKSAQDVPDHPLKTKAPVDLRLQLMGE
eukprot:INCI9552.1.p1 GENE.INCI9552.1~~INCI9552.1.p1  ORF type:complete len:1334 (+),score=243.18 INCI9552.1:147-4004(+)